MLEEVVSNIIEAEDKAEQIKKEGREAAKNLLSQAQTASEQFRADCAKECRLLSEERKANAQKKADEVYAQTLEEGKAQAEVLRKNYEKNTEKAVAAVLSALIG